jgi:hypothetical protein
LIETAAPHSPVPSQWASALAVEPVQVAAAQVTVVSPFWQAPAPLHAPVLPQGGLAAHIFRGSVVPEGTFAQVPGLPATLQAWQRAQEVAPQQTPSTQVRPLKQSVVTLQGWPWR